MNKENIAFNYTYSAKQQDEIKKIREKYIYNEEDKMEYLRRLDKSVAKPGMIVSILLGVIGTFALGIGMSLTMVWSENLFILGIIVGVFGIILMFLSYPVYRVIIKSRRKKLAPEILQITDELLK